MGDELEGFGREWLVSYGSSVFVFSGKDQTIQSGWLDFRATFDPRISRKLSSEYGALMVNLLTALFWFSELVILPWMRV
jgi:hypothetical protein